ncbi:MAG: hypothetical protein NXI32_24965, partial [bacterium]|nr:hypothetical protein [bacterium]
GDWILFGKHFAVNPANTAQRFSYFRWFRIIAIDAEPKLGQLQDLSPSGTDPYGNGANTVVWSRDVVVEGPDWTFFSTPDLSGATLGWETIGGANGIPVPTTGTLMSNVVTVIERNVSVD